MSQEQKPFAVNDRRHFTADGQARENDPAPAAPAPASPAESPSASPSGAAGPADFGQFILTLGAQAGFLLSGQGGAEGPSPHEALQDARALISILEMLKDKTEGRRTPEEDRILDGVLYELRLGYVARAGVSGA
ncbi:MAG TPA: DUF1844 domain-containing protein [Vicinamibacteria bacterium]|jgi:hypothetical protein|nr:DUF1844 domain-containing protein [Vicinamibacteria bacterium]